MDYNNDDKSVSNLAIITTANDTLNIQGTGGINLPSGLTSQRPTYQDGLIRLNTETGYVEAASGSKWVNIVDSSSFATISQIGTLSNDISGFINGTDSVISFNSSTRIFTIAPSGTSYSVYYKGTEYVISTPKTITLENTTGGRYIIYDHVSGLLVDNGASIDPSLGTIIVAYIYYDAVNSVAIVFGDERHTTARDTNWHAAQHFNVGAVWRSGGILSYTLNDDTNVNVGFTSPIIIYDEDLKHTVIHSATPSNFYEQVLSPVASLPVLYMSGSSYIQVIPTTLPWLYSGSNVAYYNSLVSGSWTLTPAPNNSFINYWVFGTNDTSHPIKMVLGRNTYTTIAGASAEILDSNGLDFPEMVLMYRITISYKNTYTNNDARVVIAEVTKYNLLSKTSSSTNTTANQLINITGDATGSGTTEIPLTLANVASAGTYQSVTINSKGLVTSGTNPTTLSGYGIIDAVNKAGDTMTGSLSLPKDKEKGLLIDGQYTWIDIIGDVTPKTGGARAAVLTQYIGAVNSWAHSATSYGDLLYHIPHEYAEGTDMFIHVHWGHNGTNIAGSFIVNFYATYAKRTYPATPFVTPVPLTLTLTSLDMTNSPRYGHRVDEILLSTPNGSANLLNTNLLEVDGLIAIHYVINTIPSITGSDFSNLPYIHTIDLHVQSKNIGTINKDPDYYGAV